MAEDWEAAPAVAETPEIKLFGKWSTDDVQINDISLQVWNIKPHTLFVLCFMSEWDSFNFINDRFYVRQLISNQLMLEMLEIWIDHPRSLTW